MSTPLMGVSSFSPLEGENIRGGYAYHPHSLDLLRTGIAVSYCHFDRREKSYL